ncbi:MAG: nitrilase family protein, partial [Muribaculaceae bacterium]|nr:nitrilase family protein [Muribaculaceae bacterium]
IAAIPLDIAQADKQANLNAAEKAIGQLGREIDLVVLPELFSTGYINDHDALIELSETNSGSTVARMKEMAKQYGVAITGSFLARIGGELRNRAFFIEPSGEEAFYDKAHLFGISQESRDLHGGEQQSPIVRYRGWNIAMIVCYDLRFPVWCRNVGNSYDLMVVPANWPESRSYAWHQLLIARAIENQAYVVGANRGGEDRFGVYPQSMTQIYDFAGKPIGAASDDVVTATIDRAALSEARRKMPVSADADTFTIDPRYPKRTL